MNGNSLLRDRRCGPSPSLDIQISVLTCVGACIRACGGVCMCVCWQARSGTALKVSPSKYAEHGGLRTGAEGEHGVAELIYLMTERLISSPALIRIHA